MILKRAVAPTKSIILNSQPKKISPCVWYRADIEAISYDTRPWTSYASLIWLETSQGKFRELGRVIKWIKRGDKKITLSGRAPQGASHVVLGVRAYCEGAHAYAKRAHLEIQDLEQCKLSAIPKSRVSFLKLFSGLKHLRPTVDLNIEMVSYCNLRCIWCSLDHNKPKQIMEPELLKLVLKQARDSKIVVRRIDLHNGGEALLHPAFGDMMRILGSARSSSGDFPYTALLTNGTILDSARCEAILKYNAVDLLRFSVDGGTREEFERIRSGARFEHIRDNIRRFVAMNGEVGHPIATGIICIIDEKYPLTTEWMSDEFREVLSLVDSFELRRPHNWDGSMDLFQVQSNENGLCYFMNSNNLVVLPNGDVTVCCADLNSRGVIGNIRNGSLADILNCENRKKMIDLMKKGRRREIRLCANCRQPSIFE